MGSPLVVTDPSRPDITGLEATKAIKAAHPEIRVLIVSIHDDDEWVLGALEAGACGYLLKQRGPAELRAAVCQVAAGERVLDPDLVGAVVARAMRPPGPPAEALTGREREVLTLLGRGLTNQDIARDLALAERTVKAHVSNLLAKLSVTSRTQAALLARDLS